MIAKWYGRRMAAWEERLISVSTNRLVRPFEWGVEWVGAWPQAAQVPVNGYDPETYLRLINEGALAAGADFFAYQKPAAFQFDGEWASFASAVHTAYPENNTVHLRYFPGNSRVKPVRKAVIVLPHWNSSPGQHVALCRGLQKLGLSSVRVSLPYHDARMPPELERADYAVSSNIGRTLDATRQAVLDVRGAADWLESRGYERIGLVGTSLGSCYGFLASAYDERIRVNVFNHCSAHFADVVWTGRSSEHIREGLEQHITLERLRQVWKVLDPSHHMDHFARFEKKSQFIYTTYDTTFLPEFSRNAVEHIRKRGLDHRVVVLPCGHYTMGETPFKFLDGYHICSFLKRNL